MNREVQLEPVVVGEREPNDPSDLDPLLQSSHDDESSAPASSSEIRNEDIENGSSVACCRICLESDSDAG